METNLDRKCVKWNKCLYLIYFCNAMYANVKPNNCKNKYRVFRKRLHGLYLKPPFCNVRACYNYYFPPNFLDCYAV